MNLRKTLSNLKTWNYGGFELQSSLNPDECKRRLKEQSINMDLGAVVANRGAAFRTPDVSVDARTQFKGNRFSLVLEREYQEKGMAAVAAKGTISRHVNGSRIKISIGQLSERIRLIKVVLVFWMVVGFVAIGGLIYTQSVSESRETLIMFGFLSLFLPSVGRLSAVTPNFEAGPKTLSFLISSLEAKVITDTENWREQTLLGTELDTKQLTILESSDSAKT